MIIDGVQITTENFSSDNPPPDHDELKNYVGYVLERVPNVEKINVALCEDGCVDLQYTAYDIPFERIRRITGRPV